MYCCNICSKNTDFVRTSNISALNLMLLIWFLCPANFSNNNIISFIVYITQLYSPQVYNVKFYDCTHEMDDDEKKKRESREEKYFPLIDDHIKMIMPKLTLPDGKMIEILQSSLIPTDVFTHGFTMRHGGVSTYKTLSSLNLVHSDKRRDLSVNVQENRRRLALTCRFAPDKFRVAKCVHEANVWVVGDQEPDSYDALVTDNSHVTIAAPGADCVPVLFCDPVKKVCKTNLSCFGVVCLYFNLLLI